MIKSLQYVLILLVVWLCFFVGITVFSFEQGEIGYTCGEWFYGWGIPPWLTLGGYGGLRDWQTNCTTGTWSFSFPYMLIGIAVAFFPIAVLVWTYLIVKRKFRFHLSTAIIILLTSCVLSGANFAGIIHRGSAGWGWPLRSKNFPYLFVTLLSDISVAVCIIFFVWYFIESWERRRDAKTGKLRIMVLPESESTK